MSVRKRADGRWIVDVVVKIAGARQRVRESAKTRDAGLRLEREIRARIDRGEKVASKAPLFDDFAKDFLEVGIATNKPSEKDAKRRIIAQHLSPQFKGLRLDQITAEMVERFVAKQLSTPGVVAKTVSNRVAVLRRLLTKAAEWGRIRSVPTFPEVAIVKREMEFFTTEQAADIVNGAAVEWRTMILVALRTGMRRGELLALRWTDVDLPHARIVVSRSIWRGVEGTTKGGRNRVIDISPEARAALLAMPTRPLRGYVFGDGVTPLTPGKLKWPLYGACTKAGVKRAGWHKLRHSFGSHLALAGVPLRAIQELMGHAKIETTMRYAHLLPGSKGAAVALLDTPSSESGRSGRDPIGARNAAG